MLGSRDTMKEADTCPPGNPLAALGLCKHRGYAVPMSALPLIAVGLRQATASLEASVSSFAKLLRIQ